ncbi:MAG: DUF1475 domain-containing protein [Steroidobacteraceae bacterium]|jgi:predicted permease|nr:DUF1475 domain-containing protein [Steroidobacteraceae bacterium]
MNKNVLRLLFGFIFASLLAYTSWASTRQPVWEWRGFAIQPDNWWTIATLVDAYYGFLTFYVWVFYKETRALARLGWFVAIMLLGNMAMSAYVLWQLARLRDDEPASAILVRRSA